MNREEFRQLSDNLLAEIDALCMDFEQAWKNGDHPSIEPLLETIGEDARSFLLRELLLTEFEWRLRNGDTVLPSDYVTRFPDIAAEISSVLKSANAHRLIQSTVPDETMLFEQSVPESRQVLSDDRTVSVNVNPH